MSERTDQVAEDAPERDVQFDPARAVGTGSAGTPEASEAAGGEDWWALTRDLLFGAGFAGGGALFGMATSAGAAEALDAFLAPDLVAAVGGLALLSGPFLAGAALAVTESDPVRAIVGALPALAYVALTAVSSIGPLGPEVAIAAMLVAWALGDGLVRRSRE